MDNIIYNFKSFKPLNNLKLINVLNKKLDYSGSFGFVEKYQKDKYICLRDRAGSIKIFYGIHKKNKKLVFSNNYIQLAKVCNSKTIFSIPKGSLSIIDRLGNVIYKKEISSQKIKFDKDFTLKVKNNLINYLTEIRKKHGNKCIVCLSGGLDSTIIAYYAKKIFKNIISITASFDEKKTESLDAYYAKKIAKFLKIKNISLKLEFGNIKKELKNILFSSQDWRDYNVHCACLNYFIAKYLKKKKLELPVLTGDMMNEFFADYQNEIINGNIYYQKPKIPKKLYQKYLINSLDTSNRETGVFSFFKIKLFQPYSSLIDFYINIPKKIFDKKNCKYEINGKLIPKSLFKMTLKSKNRAQIVNNQGGILGYFIKNGLSQKYLLKKFKKDFNLKNSWIFDFINLGLFRSKNTINTNKF